MSNKSNPGTSKDQYNGPGVKEGASKDTKGAEDATSKEEKKDVDKGKWT